MGDNSRGGREQIPLGAFVVHILTIAEGSILVLGGESVHQMRLEASNLIIAVVQSLLSFPVTQLVFFPLLRPALPV